MTLAQKIFLSIPSLFWILDFMLYVFPVELNDIYLLLDSYDIELIMNVVSFIQIAYLVYFIWQSRAPKTKKQDWTACIIFLFYPYSSLYFIWFKINEFQKPVLVSNK